MTYTDNQLKQALAKMLPEQLEWHEWEDPTHPDNPVTATSCALCWDRGNPVLDTELLHICWLIEQTLTEKQDVWFLQKLSQQRYRDGESGTIGTLLDRSIHASWQQRTIALAKVKGIEI